MPNRYYIPENIDDLDIVTSIQMVARLLRTALAEELRTIGLYPGQDKVINALVDDAELTPGEIAKLLDVRPPTITKTVARLEEQGFVQRTPSDTDRRQVTVTLTAQGKDAVKQMQKAIRRTEKRALANIKKKERKAIQLLLATIRNDLAPSAKA